MLKSIAKHLPPSYPVVGSRVGVGVSKGVLVLTYRLPLVIICEMLLGHEFPRPSELRCSTVSKKASGKEL